MTAQNGYSGFAQKRERNKADENAGFICLVYSDSATDQSKGSYSRLGEHHTDPGNDSAEALRTIGGPKIHSVGGIAPAYPDSRGASDVLSSGCLSPTNLWRRFGLAMRSVLIIQLGRSLGRCGSRTGMRAE